MNPDWLMSTLLRVQIISALSLGSVTIAIRLLVNNSFELVVWKIVTDVCKFQALLDACLSVRDSETLTNAKA